MEDFDFLKDLLAGVTDVTQDKKRKKKDGDEAGVAAAPEAAGAIKDEKSE